MAGKSATRRRFRFTLGSLLLLLTMICVGLGWLVRVWTQQKIVSRVEQTGGRVYYSYQVANERGVFAAPGHDWLRDFYDHVTLVDFDRGYAGDLTPLAALSRLEWLVLSGTSVSDLSVLTDLRLKRVDLANTQVADISALVTSKRLEWLTLNGTPVTDLSPLMGFEHLTRVDLSDTAITDISALAAAKRLDWLDVSNTQVDGISALANKSQLRHLDAANTDLRDLTALTDSAALDCLDFSGTFVNDLSPLANARSLSRFDLSNTPVRDISPLINRETLTWAALDNTQITDSSLRNLANAQALETLTIKNTAITDLGLTLLQPLTQLKSLDITGTQVTAAGVMRIRRALPNCHVRTTPLLGETFRHLELFPQGYVATADEVNTRLAQIRVNGRAATDRSRPDAPIISLSLRYSRLSDRAVLSLVDPMTELQRLSVTECLVGDDLVACLVGKPLKYLYLRATRVTDAGLEHLSQLASLQHLDLSETAITDAGLTQLKHLAQLDSLNLADTRVSRRGFSRLRTWLPNCRISWNPNRFGVQ